MQLIPILRLADNLDRSHDQRIQSVDVRTRDGEVTLLVHSCGNLDLEQWRAERAGEAFLQIYNRNVSVAKARE